MKRLGDAVDALRGLMGLKGLTGVLSLAETGLATTSMSCLLHGQTCPCRVTLSWLMKHLCETKAEEQSLLRAYSGLETLPEEAVLDDEENAQEERARALRHLEVKSQSIAFKRSVARELDKAGLRYKQDYAEGVFVTDFLIEQDGKRIALECRFNVHRDIERALLTAQVLQRELMCEQVITVTPFDISETLPESEDLITSTPSEMIEQLIKDTNTQN